MADSLLPRPITGLTAALQDGETTAEALTEFALNRAQDADGQGDCVYTRLYPESARAQAQAVDRAFAAGVDLSPLAGLPLSIKDLFDVAGEPTLAGSIVRRDAAPADRDAAIVRRLRAAGAVILGKANMVEFAYGGVGLNAHYGHPKNPWDRDVGRVSGGSSSGGAISVTDGMAVASIGTDTSGSVRIPAALTGLTGFKPTQARVSRDGCFPLSDALDSIGPIAPSVACCAIIDAVLAGEEPALPATLPVAGLRLAVPQHYVLDNMDNFVAKAFERALRLLSQAGALIVDVPFAELTRLPDIHANGTFQAAEAYCMLQPILQQREADFDRRVASRMKVGADMSAAHYLTLVQARAALIAEMQEVTQPFDAVLMPTVPIVAPTIESLDNDDDLYARTNMLLLRNPGVANFLDRCALSLPCHQPGEPPVGLTIMGECMADQQVLAIGWAIEEALAALRLGDG